MNYGERVQGYRYLSMSLIVSNFTLEQGVLISNS